MLGGMGTMMNPWGNTSSLTFSSGKRTAKNTANIFQASENKGIVSTMLRRGRSAPTGATNQATNYLQTANSKVMTSAGRNLKAHGPMSSKAIAKHAKKVWSVGRKMMGGGLLVAGAAAMAGLAIMNGAMSQAGDIMNERYMRDARYSSRLLSNSNVGSATGNSTLNTGNHVGLSLALSRRRHG